MRLHLLSVGATALCLLALTACGQRSTLVEFRHGYSFTRAERKAIEAIADRAVRDVRQYLHTLPADVEIIVQAGTNVIPETGENGGVGVPTSVYWTVDPKHPGGVIAVANAQLRATLFHELYHLVRLTQFASESLVDQAISEGLATAFERDFGGAPVPWGVYPSNVMEWTKEFLALPGDAPRDQWMYNHSDGRRWIGYKVGTYLADQAARVSRLSLAQLATVPTATIVQWGRPQERTP